MEKQDCQVLSILNFLLMKTFVFGIGGTGARVLRSLTLLLASGVECKSDIVPIIIDPDMNNGDLTRAVSLMQRYVAIKEKLNFNSNTRNKFYGTEIIDKFNFRLPINNSQNISFKKFMDYDNMNMASKAMLQMLYSTKNLASDMVVGFKGNPNIGSIVLNQFTDTIEFQNIANEFSQGDRIFIISSIFGGTGASGFPLLLNTLRTNEDIANHGLINSATIGAVTVLPYFKVNQDEESSIESDTFISKTRSALKKKKKNIGDDIDLMRIMKEEMSKRTKLTWLRCSLRWQLLILLMDLKGLDLLSIKNLVWRQIMWRMLSSEILPLRRTRL